MPLKVHQECRLSQVNLHRQHNHLLNQACSHQSNRRRLQAFRHGLPFQTSRLRLLCPLHNHQKLHQSLNRLALYHPNHLQFHLNHRYQHRPVNSRQILNNPRLTLRLQFHLAFCRQRILLFQTSHQKLHRVHCYRAFCHQRILQSRSNLLFQPFPGKHLGWLRVIVGIL